MLILSFSNAQFPVLIYLDQTLIDKHTDVPLQSCLELEAQQFCAFWETFVLALEKPVSVEEILERWLEQHQASTFIYPNLWLEGSCQEWNDHYECTCLFLVSNCLVKLHWSILLTVLAYSQESYEKNDQTQSSIYWYSHKPRMKSPCWNKKKMFEIFNVPKMELEI